MSQIELFPTTVPLPCGFVCQTDFISRDEEKALLGEVDQLPFAEIRMHGVVAKRRAAHFGRSYEYDRATVGAAAPIPECFLPLRSRVAEFTGCRPEEFAELLVTEYPPGAPIGWHRDAPAFDIIAGVSLLSECSMHFRPWPVESPGAARRKPLTQLLQPRSIYVIAGESRTSWQHHIPPAKTRRVSLTFRTLRPSVENQSHKPGEP